MISRFRTYLWQLHPLAEFSIVVFVTFLAAIPVYLLSSSRHRDFDLYYMVPTLIPFGMFLLDRNRSGSRGFVLSIMLDVVVLGVSIARVFTYIPWVSGHSLFLSYAALTASRDPARVVAAIGLGYTVFYKFTHFDDLRALYGGIFFGTMAAILYRLNSRAPQPGASKCGGTTNSEI